MSPLLQSIPAASRYATLLSNGRYALVLSASGSGLARWDDNAVTRWREDPTCDGWGSYVILSDLASGAVWSPSLQPCGGNPAQHTAAFSEGLARFAHVDDGLSTTLEVAVASDRDAELRRITIQNHGDTVRDIALTSYAELVLGSAAGDATHPAFSKLFVQTEALTERRILLAHRRRRSPGDPDIWAAHFVADDERNGGAFEFETDRARFLGRGRTLRNAHAIRDRVALSNSAGTVLDPIFSLRRTVHLSPGATARVTFWTVVADARGTVLDLCNALRTAGETDRAMAGAIDQASGMRKRFGLDSVRAQEWERLIAPLVSADPAWRSSPATLERGSGGAPVLGTRGISGDRPLVLMRVAVESRLERVRELLRVQRYWQSQRFGVDVVLLNCATEGACAELQGRVDTLVDEQRGLLRTGAGATPAAVFGFVDREIADAFRDGLGTAARVILDAASDGIGGPIEVEADIAAPATKLSLSSGHAPRLLLDVAPAPRANRGQIEFANGIGGFDAAAREYVITLKAGRCTPMPWVNIVANPSFGFMASAEGGGYTWSVSSQQNPLTPWPNDPVSDTPHEVLYLKDEDSGELWSATASPIRVPSADYAVRHGKGYCVFAHEAHGIQVELLQCVPLRDSIKLSRLRIRNRSARVRSLSVTAYVEWALGGNGTVPAPFVITSVDAATGALLARNPWRAEFGERVALVDLGGVQTSVTADRTEFLGRHGALDRPAALLRSAPLSGRVGAGLDPCAALQTRAELPPGAQVDIVFALGDAESAMEARQLIEKYRGVDVDAVLDEARALWDDVLDTVQVRTPDRAMDLMLNDWLLYQALACRMWARTAYYQASGAYGFRDQLQDVMALCVAKPALVREHLLRTAARQFVEGDVQHWWLPPAGQGIRTRMTDDRVWLPFVVAHYVEVTGDAAVLDERVPFIAGDALKDDQDESFFKPAIADEVASLYEHCARALDISLSVGAHGLSLIGTGDWNDGMNRVGEKGRGESTWMTWFLLSAIAAFTPHARARSETARIEGWQQFAATAPRALETTGWDGGWYRRGYYDDGSPLGSNASSECRIDAIAQSWSVISGVGAPGHAATAMDEVESQLIRHDDKIALLFTPPFDHSTHDPGYIKGYPPGIRENGGQYTHGTIWSIFAFAALSQGDRAGDLFAILNPVHHGSTPSAVSRYQVEPYVVCADVYSVAPHVGRGGWTWYTGSAGWLYRAGLEAILGLHVRGNAIRLDPCIPKAWSRFEITLRRRSARNSAIHYEIAVENPRHVSRGIVAAELDGVRMAEGAASIPLLDDGAIHRLRVELG